MPQLVRCPSTNVPIGEYYMLFRAVKKHRPDDIVKVLKECGLTEYPQIMRMVSHVRFIDAHLIHKQ